MRIRFWFRRKPKPAAADLWDTGFNDYADDTYPFGPDDDPFHGSASFWERYSTTAKGDTYMAAAFTKTPEFSRVADGEATGVYATARRAQGFLDDITELGEVVRVNTRTLNSVRIEDKKATQAILAAMEDSGDLATELEDLFEDMAAGWGRELKKPAKGKAPVDPSVRLETVLGAAEQMRERGLYLLGNTLKTAFEGNTKQIKAALTGSEASAHLVEALLAVQETRTPEESAEPEAEASGGPKAPVVAKHINHVDAGKVSATA